MNFEIISTGSKGNALLLENMILIDCGVSYKKIADREFNIVLLTHIHSDHFRKMTVKRLHAERPLLRFGCFPFMANELVQIGVDIRQIDVYEMGETYDYGVFSIKGFPLVHDVPNGGYEFEIAGQSGMYATDTASMGHLSLKDKDYYFIEANYEEAELAQRIKEKQDAEEFCYETRVESTHLSLQQANEFLSRNARPDSKVIFLHQHEFK